MDLHWYGHSCFRLRSSSATVLTDPYGRGTGYKLPRLRADVVTVSHTHAGHSNVRPFQGKAMIIEGPGEYEVKGVFVIGVRTAHDSQGGTERGENTAYCITIDDLNVCHLGDLGHRPTRVQLDALGQVDLLLLPVGGGNSLDASAAADVVGLMEPAVVVPMHCRSPGRPELATTDKFLTEMGVARQEPQEMLRLQAGRLPEETQVVLLQPRQ